MKHIELKEFSAEIPEDATAIICVLEKGMDKSLELAQGSELDLLAMFFSMLKKILKNDDGHFQAAALSSGYETLKEVLAPDVKITVSYRGEELRQPTKEEMEKKLAELSNMLIDRLFGNKKPGGCVSDAEKDS